MVRGRVEIFDGGGGECEVELVLGDDVMEEREVVGVEWRMNGVVC